jgi:hypothetical protein
MMIADYKHGFSIQTLSRKYHTNPRRITRELKAAEVVLRLQGPQPGLWLGRSHSIEARTRIAMARRAIIQPNPTSSYRQKRQADVCPKTGLGESAWVRLQLKKANYTCQVTGKRGIKLSVHHLYGVSTHPQLRWDEANIIVVDQRLHNRFHFQFMRGPMNPVTPDDWQDFLRS